MNNIEINTNETEINDIELMDAEVEKTESIDAEDVGNENVWTEERQYAETTLTWQQMLDFYKGAPVYTSEEEIEAFGDYKKEPTQEKRENLIAHNMRLVISIAAKYQKVTQNVMTIDDLVQEGFFGLLIAIEKFEPDKGYKFSTYATWWIRQAITRSITAQKNMIRIPVHATELYLKYNQYLKIRKSQNLPEPTDAELIKALKIKESELMLLKDVIKASQVDSLSKIVTEGDHDVDTELMFFIKDPTAEADYLNIENKELRNEFEKMLAKYLKRMPESNRYRNEKILRMRLGLNETGDVLTLSEIGDMYGITKERVRQIENNFIKYLRSPSQLKILKEYL